MRNKGTYFLLEETLRPAAIMQYTGEEDIHYVMDLVDNELSEPYSIFTYRYAVTSCVTSAATA